MSREAEALTWKRARVGKAELLMLVKIADLCPEDEGRNCYAEIPYLAQACRMSIRGAQYILRRLEALGEIEIEYNEGGREITTRGGRSFRPKWFIHVRCVCAWEAYQGEPKERAKAACFSKPLRTGRPRRKHAKPAGFGDIETRNPCIQNAQKHVEKRAIHDIAYKERTASTQLIEQRAGAAPRTPPPEDPEENLNVITKLAHEVLDVLGLAADLGDVAEAVKSRCASLQIRYWPGDVVRRAIDSAKWQRTHTSTEAH